MPNFADVRDEMTRRNQVDAEDQDINVESDMDFLNKPRPFSSSGKKKSKVVIPDKGANALWQDFVILTVLCVVCGEAFLAAFDATPTALWVLMYICDFIYLVDMVLMFFTAYKNKDGIWITHRRKIVYHYLAGHFPLDVLSMLPIGLIAFSLNHDELWMNMSFLRLNRLLRVYRIFAFFGHREEDLVRSTTTTRGLKYVTICIITTHFITCGWYRMACDSKHENANRTCVEDSWANQFDLGFNILNAGTLDSYVASLYWAVATATSTGYGDIYALTIPEKWYSICSMLLGIAVFFGMLLGGMTSLLTNFDSHRANYVHRFQTIKGYLKDLEVDPALIARVNSYYEYLWQQKNGVVGHGIYSKLPVTFQAEISHSTHHDVIDKTPLFKDLDPGFLRMLSLNIKQALYLPSQIIQRRGDLGKEMFFIMHGEIEVMSEDDDETPVATLRSGSVFGEMNLIISLPRTATVRAKTHCDLLIIDKDDLHHILKYFPNVSLQLNDEAKKRFSKIAEILEKRRNKKSKDFKPKTLVQPQWLRKASFLPTKEDLSAFSESTVTALNSKKGGGLGDIDIEKLRNIHKQDQRSLSQTCHLVWHATIKRSSPFIKGWTYTIVVVTVLHAIIQPYMAAFTGHSGRKGYFDIEGEVLLAISYLLDVILFLDIWITFRTEVPGQYASINDHKTIAKMYVTSTAFWIDLLSILPLEILCLVATGTRDRSRLFGFLRLNRLIKMVKTKNFFETMEGYLHVTIGSIRSLKLLTYICLLSHWAACAMFLMVCYGETCKSPSWLSSRNETYLVETAVTEYITSIYWAAATMSSTGYGDISASTTLGRFLSLCIMLIGLLLYGYCLALMAATLANDDAPRVRFQEKLFAVQKFMKENHLSIHLQHQVIAYMGLIWEKYNGDWMPGQESLIYDAPMVLQKDITFEDACKTVAKVPLFLHTDENFLRSVALKLQTYLYNPGDVVIYCKDVGREMYCIRKGWCRVQTEKGKRLSEIGPGSYIGEVGLLFGDTRSATVVALTHCELVMLTLDDLHEVLKSHPIVKEQFEQAERRKAELMDLKERYAQMMLDDLAKSQPASEVEVTKVYSTTERVAVKHSSTKTFSAAPGTSNRDYLDPFRGLNPFVRLLSKVLMKKTFFNDGPFLRGWVILMVIVAFINSFTVTLQASFMHQSPYIWAVNYLLDIVCFVNIYISFHITFYNDKQILVSHPLSTAKHYTVTTFLMDLLACFPIEVIAYAAYPHLNYDGLYMLSLVRLNRVLQVYRIPMLFSYLESSVDKETGVLREIKFGFYSLIFLHWLTCTFFILACPSNLLGVYSGYVTLSSGHHCLSASWLVGSGIDALSAASTKLYVTCLYWAAATSVSVGYGDISAGTDAEMVVSLIAMVSGVMFFGYIIASVAASLANADAQRARFQEKLSSVTQYIKREKVEAPLQKRVLKYYDYVWLRTRGVDPESLFNVLPLSLWGDVTLDLYKSTLEGIELFKGTETSFLKMLSRCIKPLLYLKGEYVVKKFDMGSVMFFIQRGAVDVVSEDGKVVFATMRDGNSFGEVALLFSVPRTASIRAGTNADLFCLSKGDLDNVLDLYPKVKETVMEIAEERRQQARKRSMVKANAAKVKSKSSVTKASKSKVTTESSTKTAGATLAPEPEKDSDSDDDGPLPEPSEQEIAENMDVQFEGVLPGSDEENENSSNNKNNNANWNQNNSGRPLDPDYGQFTNLEDWEEIALGRVLAGQAFPNTNRNNPADNTNQNNDKKDEGETAEETPKRKCDLFHRLAELNRFTVRPSSKWLKMFDSLLCVVGFISVWAITYQAAYQDHHTALIVANYIMDVFFFIKIYVCFHTSFYDHYGHLTDDFDDVYKAYFKSPKGFALDFITAFPIDIFALAAPSGDKWMILSYLRILHCLRIIRVSNYFANWEKGLNINMLAARLSKFFVILVLLIHFLSCIWYTLACPIAKCSIADTWVQHKALVMETPMDAYCVCFYWTVATMTSTGYGDIYAINVKEMIYAAIVMVVGKLMFGFILGNIASTLSNEEIQKVQYQEQLQVIKGTMDSQKVPEDIEEQVIEYMVHLWYRNKGVDRWSLFKDAPDCLQAELFLKIASKMFEAIPLLEGADEAFLRSLALSVQQNIYIPGNYIMRKGDVGQEVYYVHKGKVEVWDDDKMIQVLQKGEIFGEVSLLCSMARQVTVVARTHVDLLVLSMADLEEVIESYPAVGAQIHHAGYQRFKDILPADYAKNHFT